MAKKVEEGSLVLVLTEEFFGMTATVERVNDRNGLIQFKVNRGSRAGDTGRAPKGKYKVI